MRSTLKRLARDFSVAVPEVDADAAHDRWQPGIGPFEETNQVRMILERLRDRYDFYHYAEASVPYPDSRRQCDLVIDRCDGPIPVEAKLLRFRRDNNTEDPNRYTTVFSPFNSNNPTTLMNDAQRLYTSEFDRLGGLLGIYYERKNEPLSQMDIHSIAEKFSQDVGYWYEFEAEMVAIAEFEGLRHPVFQQGAVVTWEIVENQGD